MAKNRYLNTHFWSDKFVRKLDKDGTILFFYLLTSPVSNIAGIYEITLERISFDTKLTIPEITSNLVFFEKSNKILYFNDYIIIINFLKHQKLNPNTKKGIESIINGCPDEVRRVIIDRLSKAFKGFELFNLILFNLNSNLNPNLNPNPNIKCGKPHDISLDALGYLNKTCSKGFKPVKTNLDLIKALFDKGYKIDDLKAVIDLKKDEWLYDDKQVRLLRPSTLFSLTNFEKYHGEIGAKVKKTNLNF